jgi:Phage integrase family
MKGCRALTDDEVARVIQAFRGTYAARDRALFVLGIKTGFRIAELLSLRMGDVWQHGQFLDRVAVLRRYMKGQGQRPECAFACRGEGRADALAQGDEPQHSAAEGTGRKAPSAICRRRRWFYKWSFVGMEDRGE